MAHENELYYVMEKTFGKLMQTSAGFSTEEDAYSFIGTMKEGHSYKNKKLFVMKMLGER